MFFKIARFFLPCLLFAGFSYQVEFIGLQDTKTLKIIQNESSIIQLLHRPPTSINGLRYRIKSDIPEMIKILHAAAYYDAEITYEIRDKEESALVYIFIHPGPQYILSSYDFFSGNCQEKEPLPGCHDLTLHDLGLEIKKPALAEEILKAENILLQRLGNCGYPLANIESREVIVDAAVKTVAVKVCVKVGPLCKFGPISMVGLHDINIEFIARKILWEEGEIYTENLIDKTQRELIETDLFSSVLISHAETLDASGLLPIKIRFNETKHKSISLGAGYATWNGPSAYIGWSNRNFRHMGEQLTLEVNANQMLTTGSLSYVKPDFYRRNQNFLSRAELMREHITVYIAQTWSWQNLIERNFSKNTYASWGIRGEYIDITNSINNGKFALISLPIYVNFKNVENILDPTKGVIVNYWIKPYQNITNRIDTFFWQYLDTSFYAPLSKNRSFVLAIRAQIGSIFGAGLYRIPFNRRFLAGSENDLRGYEFKTVSPLNDRGKPTGGRGAIYFSFESRFKMTKKIGIVPFFDVGNVTNSAYPTVLGKWYKDVGLGLRYFTFFGPLRLDIGIPLDRRNFDPRYRIYISVGQTY